MLYQVPNIERIVSAIPLVCPRVLTADIEWIYRLFYRLDSSTKMEYRNMLSNCVSSSSNIAKIELHFEIIECRIELPLEVKVIDHCCIEFRVELIEYRMYPIAFRAFRISYMSNCVSGLSSIVSNWYRIERIEYRIELSSYPDLVSNWYRIELLFVFTSNITLFCCPF